MAPRFSSAGRRRRWVVESLRWWGPPVEEDALEMIEEGRDEGSGSSGSWRKTPESRSRNEGLLAQGVPGRLSKEKKVCVSAMLPNLFSVEEKV